MAIAYSYRRFSSKAQSDGDSIRRQTESAREWCSRSGAILDTSLSFEELGTSAWLGEHRKNPDRNALASFLKMIEPGPHRGILPGSFLIVETLCRLTREDIQPALQLILGILQNGIRIVQLKPEVIYDSSSDAFHVMMMIMELTRAHGESETKSHMIRKAWQAKKELARREGVPMSKKIPGWLRLVGDKFEVIEDIAEIVRQVYQLAIDGLGANQIAKKLIRDKVPPFNPSRRWTVSFVTKLLVRRSVLGEHQPWDRSRRGRKKDGEPILNYYPAIIDEQTWLMAQAAQRERYRHRGRHGVEVNVFAGLLRDAVNGGAYYASSTTSKGYFQRILINNEAAQGRATIATFPFAVFERAILERFKEIPVGDLRPQSEAVDRTKEMRAELARLKKQHRRIVEELEQKEDVSALATAAERLEKRIADLNKRISDEEGAAALAAIDEWPEAQTLMDAIDHDPNPPELRLQLRSILRRTISSIYLVIARADGRAARACAAQVFFRDRNYSRSYIIWHRRGCRHRKQDEPVVQDTTEEPIDLRQRDAAKRLSERLQQPGRSPWPAGTLRRENAPRRGKKQPRQGDRR